jgi:hypothetical protein
MRSAPGWGDRSLDKRRRRASVAPRPLGRYNGRRAPRRLAPRGARSKLKPMNNR